MRNVKPAAVFLWQARFAEPQCTAVGTAIANVSTAARTGVIIGRPARWNWNDPWTWIVLQASRGLARSETRPVALITGASSGIGAALAHVFAQNGHEVVLTARRVPQLAEMADRIRDDRTARAHPAGRPLPRRRRRAHRAGACGAQSRAGLSRQQCGLRLARPGRDARPRRATCDDRPQLPHAHRSLAALGQRARAPSRRHPQRGVDLGLHPRPRHDGLQRLQGLCDLVQRRAAARASAQRHPRHRALPRPGRRPNSRRAPASSTCTTRAASTAPPRRWRGRVIAG